MKQLNIRMTLFAVALSLCLLAGCTSTKQDESDLNDKIPPSALKKLSDAERLKLVQPIIDSICAGLKADDYGAYTKDFTVGLKEKITRSEFEKQTGKMKEDVGDLVSKQYLGVLNKELFDVFLWKCTFSKHKDEYVMKLFLIDEDGTYKVYMFQVYPF